MSKRRTSRFRPTPSEDSPSTRIPVWARDTITVVGALVAVAGVVLTLIQVLDDDDGDPDGVVTPHATIEEMTFEPTEVVANGGFRLVDLAAEVILFVRKQEDAGESRWVLIEASTTPDDEVDGERVNGHWNAIFPVNESGKFSWQALVAEASGQGVSDVYDEIRRLGPDSQYVVGASKVFVPDE